MLQVNVAQLLKAQVGTTKSFEISDKIKIEGSESTVEGEFELIRTNRGLLLRGKVKADVEAECCRCLNAFKYPAEAAFEEEAYPSIDIISGYEAEEPKEDSAVIIDEHHILDIEDVIRQYLLLVLPMKPVCKSDCSGIDY